MTTKTTVDPSQRSAADRLRTALDEMLRRRASGDAHGAMTITALCQLAKVSRNALYRYHPEVLHELHRIQGQRRRDPDPDQRALLQLRNDNAALSEQVAKLAALVDHYFAAWQETRTLLERREREISELRKYIKPKLMPVRN